MKKLFLVLVATLLLTNFCLASEQISPRGISKVQVYTTYAIVQLESPGQNIDGCTRNGAEKYVAISFRDAVGKAEGKELYSAVLSARVTVAPIGFGVSGCKDWGSGTVPLVYRVDL